MTPAPFWVQGHFLSCLSTNSHLFLFYDANPLPS